MQQHFPFSAKGSRSEVRTPLRKQHFRLRSRPSQLQLQPSSSPPSHFRASRASIKLPGLIRSQEFARVLSSGIELISSIPAVAKEVPSFGSFIQTKQNTITSFAHRAFSYPSQTLSEPSVRSAIFRGLIRRRRRPLDQRHITRSRSITTTKFQS